MILDNNGDDDNNNKKDSNGSFIVGSGGMGHYQDSTYLSPPFSRAVGSIFLANKEPITGKQSISLMNILLDIIVGKRIKISSSILFQIFISPGDNSKFVAEFFNEYVKTFHSEVHFGRVDVKNFRNFVTEGISVPGTGNRFNAINSLLDDSDFSIIAAGTTRKEMEEFSVTESSGSKIDVSCESFYAYVSAMEKNIPAFVIWNDGEVSENKVSVFG